MKKEEFLYLENRRKLYNLINKNPGLHFREINRFLKVPKSTIDYHLIYLKKKNLIKEIKDTGYLRYYVSDKIGVED